MIPLDADRWRELTRFDGTAEIIPELLRDLANDPGGDEAWRDLYDFLFEDQLASEAAYAATPHVLAIWGRNQGRPLFPFLVFVGFANQAFHRSGSAKMPADLRSPFLDAVEQARMLLSVLFGQPLTAKARDLAALVAMLYDDYAAAEVLQLDVHCPDCSRVFSAYRQASKAFAG